MKLVLQFLALNAPIFNFINFSSGKDNLDDAFDISKLQVAFKNNKSKNDKNTV